MYSFLTPIFSIEFCNIKLILFFFKFAKKYSKKMYNLPYMEVKVEKKGL